MGECGCSLTPYSPVQGQNLQFCPYTGEYESVKNHIHAKTILCSETYNKEHVVGGNCRTEAMLTSNNIVKFFSKSIYDGN